MAALHSLRAAPARENVPGRHVQFITVQGDRREYILQVPARYTDSTPLPLVIMMHGRGGNGQIAERAYGWPELAERENFIVCFPTAQGDRRGIPTWNAGYNAGRGATDDVPFLSALIAHLKQMLAIDPKRVYVCGHSSGAMMSYRFGAERSGDVAAIGVASGSIGSSIAGDLVRIPRPITPVPVVAFHGIADPIVPYDWHTGTESGLFRLRFVPAPESVRFFADADGCAKTPRREEMAGGAVIRETFSGGKEGAEVVFYSTVQGGHEWPGGRAFQRAADARRSPLSATTLMWDFFKAHPRR